MQPRTNAYLLAIGIAGSLDGVIHEVVVGCPPLPTDLLHKGPGYRWQKAQDEGEEAPPAEQSNSRTPRLCPRGGCGAWLLQLHDLREDD